MQNEVNRKINKYPKYITFGFNVPSLFRIINIEKIIT